MLDSVSIETQMNLQANISRGGLNQTCAKSMQFSFPFFK